MMRVLFSLMLILLVNCRLPLTVTNPEIHEVHLKGHAQGTTWSIIYFSEDSSFTNQDAERLLQSIDSSLSIYKSYSIISAFNKSERGVKIDAHFRKVVSRSFAISRETNGLSDITIAPLVSAWGFGTKPNEKEPAKQLIDSLLQFVGIDKIKIKEDSLVKDHPSVQIDVNGIAQGYTVDVLAEVMENRGINDYLVELGGELRVKGKKRTSGEYFKIGIETPSNGELDLPMQQIIQLKEGALTTSGNYRKYIENGGRRLSHIIDPRNGLPVENEMISVTVFAQDAITADAYDNALMLMGMNEAIKFIDDRPELAAFLIYRSTNGEITAASSRKFKSLFNF